MMFNRALLKELGSWAETSDHKPLILRGARQVGKTTVVNIFSKKFKQYIYLNLEKIEERKIFENDFSFQQLIDALFFLKNAEKDNGSTLIFIDEIQYSPKAVEYLRYFYEEAPHLFVIAAGSLLETLIDRHISFPVGRVDYLAVRPCTFGEFLSATGEDKSKEIMSGGDVPEYAFGKLSELFKIYTTIGGMPEIIMNYAENRDLSKIQVLYNRLIVSYLDDVEKYARNNTYINVIRHIINSAFQYAGNRIKFERFANSNYRSREMGESFRILEKAMILQMVYPVTKVNLPIQPNYNRSPKLLMLDTGLVNYSAGLQKELFSSIFIDDVYRGKIAEHIVGQELLALDRSVIARLNFWTREERNSQAEVDYIYKFKDMLIPVEVKSGPCGSLRSLHKFIDKSPHSFAVRFYSSKMKIEKAFTVNKKKYTLLNLPLFMAGQIDKVLEKYI